MGFKKVASGILLLLFISIVLAFFLVEGFGGSLNFIDDSASNISEDTVTEETRTFCQNEKERKCQNRETLNISDYPQTCKQDGRIVIDNPYLCE
jgi:hypothetical protein